MIRIELPWLIFAYLLVFLAAIFVFWGAREMMRKYRDARALRHRLQCTLCGLEFEDRTDTPLAPCPRCGRLNERTRVRIY